MIKAVVFDLGKVLVDFDYSIAARKLAARATMTVEELGLMLQSPLLFRYETGLLTSAEFYREVCFATGFRGTFDEFGALFGDIFAPIQPMLDLQATLRGRGYRTYIFSNTNELAIRFIRDNFPFFKNFDGYILSYEHRAMKPDSAIYEAVERASGNRGGEILYLDDRAENIAAGTARGWQAFVHETPAKTREVVAQLGLLDRAPQAVVDLRSPRH